MAAGAAFPLVDFSVLSSEVRLLKPDLEIFRRACEGLGVNPEDCLYVGDGNSQELLGASRAKMRPVLIRFDYTAGPEAFRLSRKEWLGPRVQCLAEVLGLLAG